MGRRKTTIKMPKVATLRCPQCSKTQRIEVDVDKALQSYQCKHCEQEIKSPVMQCCVVCAFSGKKCPYSVKMEAFSKGLQIK